MALEEKLTEKEIVNIITDVYTEKALDDCTNPNFGANSAVPEDPTETFDSIIRGIPPKIKDKQDVLTRLLFMYLTSEYIKTRDGKLKSLGEIETEIGRSLSLKIGELGRYHTTNYSVIAFMHVNGLITVEKIMSFHETKDLAEILECYTVPVFNGFAVCKLGTGKGGSVYKVYRNDLEQFYAFKLIDQEKINKKELKLMARLERRDLENIVGILDGGTHLTGENWTTPEGEHIEGKYAILMEYIDGQTLEEILSERKLTPHEVLDYSAQILNGIKSLRKYGITHRDLKPKNIKVNTQGEVKILDFGIATDESHPEARNNQEFGAPTNMEADDLISFGLLVYKMATGKNLIDVPGKETMGSGTYADEIDRIKQSLYRNGKITEEYDKKIWGISSDDYDPLHDDYTNCTHEEHNIKSLLGDIIRSALWEKEFKILTGKYPTPYTFKIMDAKELRQLLFLSMKDGEELAFDNYVLHCKVKPS